MSENKPTFKIDKKSEGQREAHVRDLRGTDERTGMAGSEVIHDWITGTTRP